MAATEVSTMGVDDRDDSFDLADDHPAKSRLSLTGRARKDSMFTHRTFPVEKGQRIGKIWEQCFIHRREFLTILFLLWGDVWWMVGAAILKIKAM